MLHKALISASLFASVFGLNQLEECNFVYFNPLDWCDEGISYSYMYTCDFDLNAVNQTTYDDGECGEEWTNYVYYDLDDYDETYAVCNSDYDNCPYSVYIYGVDNVNDDCSDLYWSIEVFVWNGCDTDWGYEYDCGGEYTDEISDYEDLEEYGTYEYFTSRYFLEDDCSGDPITNLLSADEEGSFETGVCYGYSGSYGGYDVSASNIYYVSECYGGTQTSAGGSGSANTIALSMFAFVATIYAAFC